MNLLNAIADLEAQEGIARAKVVTDAAALGVEPPDLAPGLESDVWTDLERDMREVREAAGSP